VTSRSRDAGTVTQPHQGEWPSNGVAWYAVAVLMLASVMSLIDRQVLNLLVDPIRASLGLSDLQIGILQGPAFMVCYTLLGFPAGWWADRAHRLRLIATGLVVWSLATIACGLADSYGAMLVARATVGIGEAVLAPATLSLIADYFAPQKRPLAMSVQGTAQHAGIGLSLLAGGALMAAASGMEPLVLAGLPPIDGWRFVFIACGLPGILVAILVLAAREPPRRSDRSVSVPAVAFLAFVRDAKRWILGHFTAISLVAVLSYSVMAWAPSYLIRRFGWSIGEAGLALGLMFAVLGPLGSLLGGFLARAFQMRGEPDGALRVLRIGTLGLAIGMAALALPWSSRMVVLPLAAAVFFLTMLPVVSAMAVQQVSPNAVRGRVAASYYIVTNLIGAGLGPLVTAGLTQYVFRDPAQLGLSLATMAAIGGPIVIILLTRTLEPYRALVAARAAD
jgi:MFS family permease